MGSGKSVPRKITIDNPDDATIIKVTENVVDRLQDIKKPTTTRASSSPTTSVSGFVDEPPSSTTDKAVASAAATSSNTAGAGADTVFVTSHQIRNQIDEAIDNNNAYWENRVKALREGYSKINNELKSEYETAVAEVNRSWGKQYMANEKNDMQTCKQTEQEVIQCYKSNRDRSLLCYEHAKNFNQCVSNQTNALLKAN